MFTDKKYMEFKDVQLKTPLLSVKRAEKGKDTLIVPDGIAAEIKAFLNRDKIEYQIIKNPSLDQKEQLKADMQRYLDIDGS